MADDPEPVDYFNPHAKPEPAAKTEPPPPLPVAVIPAEFDAELSRSADHAGVAAVETALRAMHIDTFRADDGESINRAVVLYVRAADFDRAAQVAGRVFARRARVKKMNTRRDPVGEEHFGMGALGGIGGYGIDF